MLYSEFFSQNTLDVAKNLLGKVIIRNYSGNFLYAKIVETEAYLGLNDRACHSYGGVVTKRNSILYKPAGTIYVYLIYGMYELFNIVTTDKPEAVLIRAVEPINGIEFISKNRYNLEECKLSSYQKKNLTNGPGKLTKALKIDRSFNGKSFDESFYIDEPKLKEDFKIITDNRIGIDYAGEAKDYPYRFYIDKNPYVSKLKSKS